MKRAIILILALVMTTGCAAHRRHVEARKQAEYQKMQEQSARIREGDTSTCKAYGYQEGTEGMANCRMQINSQRMEANRAAYEASVRNADVSRAVMQQNLDRQNAILLQSMPQQRDTTITRCRPDYGGGFTCNNF